MGLLLAAPADRGRTIFTWRWDNRVPVDAHRLAAVKRSVYPDWGRRRARVSRRDHGWASYRLGTERTRARAPTTLERRALISRNPAPITSRAGYTEMSRA